MKKKWLGIRITVGLCAALGWWGLLYPELTLTPDTVKVCEEAGDGECASLSRKWNFEDSLYLDILNADRDKITFRSRLLTELGTFWETFYGRNNVK